MPSPDQTLVLENLNIFETWLTVDEYIDNAQYWVNVLTDYKDLVSKFDKAFKSGLSQLFFLNNLRKIIDPINKDDLDDMLSLWLDAVKADLNNVETNKYLTLSIQDADAKNKLQQATKRLVKQISLLTDTNELEQTAKDSPSVFSSNINLVIAPKAQKAINRSSSQPSFPSDRPHTPSTTLVY